MPYSCCVFDELSYKIISHLSIGSVTPDKYLQNSVNGVESEAHISCWCSNEMDQYTDLISIQKDLTTLCLLRGFHCELEEFNLTVASFGKSGI